jgi:DNA-binding NarL/FixJ family response regulator
MRILVAAASKDERHAIVDALAALDRVVVQGAVADAASVVRALGEAHPDLVVATISLDDGDGLHLIEEVRRVDAGMPIVVIGHEPSRDNWRAHLEAGADRFVDADDGFLELQDVVATFVRRERPTPRMTQVPLREALTALRELFEELRKHPSEAALCKEISSAMEHATACLEQLTRQRS